MKMRILAAVLFVSLVGVSAYAFRALPSTSQITAPVTAITPDVITIQPKDSTIKWEIGRDAKTKTTGTPKIGDTVRIMYRMNAASIEVLPPKGK